MQTVRQFITGSAVGPIKSKSNCMKGLSTELESRFFSLIIIALLTYMTFKVGGFEWVKRKDT